MVKFVGAFQAVFAVSVLGFHSSLTAGIQAPLPGFHQSNLLVPTSINSGIPSACDDYTYIVNSYDCEDIASSDADIQVMHCVSRESWSDGVIIFHRLLPAQQERQDVYRLRVVGHEIQLLPIHYCARGLALAPYRVLLNSSFHFEALHLYQNFSYEHHPKLLGESSIELAQFQKALPGRQYLGDIGCAWQDGCPVCTDPRAQGRWLVKYPEALGLESTCIVSPSMRTKDGNPMCGDLKLHILATSWTSHQGLHWQPYSCRVMRETEIDVVGCAEGRRICFVGDSHMRHSYNGVTSLFRRSYDWHGAVGAAKTEKGILQGGFTEYFLNNLGDPSWNSSGCTDVVANFGQWLGASDLDQPFSIHVYVDMLTRMITHLQQLQIQGVSVHWMTTNSFPLWHGTWYNPKRQDWRTDPILLILNRVANKMMEDAGIPIVDTYAISAPLNDVSYDSAHYRGHVGFAMDLRILNALCPSLNTAPYHVSTAESM